MGWYRWEDGDLILRLRVQPRASRDEFAGVQGERLRVRIAAPPVDGKANAYLGKFLAKEFQVAKSAVTLISGATSREKCFRIGAPRRLAVGIDPCPQ